MMTLISPTDGALAAGLAQHEARGAPLTPGLHAGGKDPFPTWGNGVPDAQNAVVPISRGLVRVADPGAVRTTA